MISFFPYDIEAILASVAVSQSQCFQSDNGGPEAEDNEEEDVGISIETTQDGTLKLSCADPQVLQVS